MRFQSVLSGSCLPHMPDQTGGQAAEPFLLCVERAAEDLPDMVHPVADGVAVDEHRIRNLPDAAVILQVVFECPDIFGIVGGIIVLKRLQVFFLKLCKKLPVGDHAEEAPDSHRVELGQHKSIPFPIRSKDFCHPGGSLRPAIGEVEAADACQRAADPDHEGLVGDSPDNVGTELPENFCSGGGTQRIDDDDKARIVIEKMTVVREIRQGKLQAVADPLALYRVHFCLSVPMKEDDLEGTLDVKMGQQGFHVGLIIFRRLDGFDEGCRELFVC